MDKFDIKLKRLIFVLLLGLVVFFSYCSKGDRTDINKVIFRDREDVLTKWDDVFEYRGVVPFKFDTDDMEIFSIGNMEINAAGEYIIQDSRAGQIMLFDASGKFVRNIGRQGEGPGEFLVPGRFCLDKNQDLYIFDQGKRNIISYSYPGYEYKNQVRLDDSITDMFVNNKGIFIIYRLASNNNRLLFSYDSRGKKLNSFLEPKQENLGFFLKRFLIGKIVDIPGEGFLFIYPEDYKIYLLSYDLHIKKTFTVKNYSQFYPCMGEFPGHLSPFDFSKEHIKWMEKSLYPVSLFYPGKGIFITVLFESFKEGNVYINVHGLDGSNYARGLLVPFSGIIRYGRNGDLYVIEESMFDDKGDIIPLKLHHFKIKDLK